MKYTAPKGTRDILPEEIFKWKHVEKTFDKVCELYGYSQIRIPTFESTEVFSRGVGDLTDVVQKEMYTFDDKGGRSITLRPEGTAGVARSFVENGMSSKPFPIKLYYDITAFRYENVQKGRYREFHQLGAELFGAPGPGADAEIISMLSAYFGELGIENSMLRINSIGCPVCRAKYNEKLLAYLEKRYDSLCPVCKERYTKNPLRVLDCKEQGCIELTKDAPLLADHLCDECNAHFEGVKEHLGYLDIAYTVDKRIVRGLDYYTRTVFEFVSDNVGTQGTICGGGRYDGLISQFGGGSVPGIGFALGLERLLLELDALNVAFKKDDTLSVYLVGMGDEGQREAFRISETLRRSGIKAETDIIGRSFKAQLKFAGKSGYSHLVVIGEKEIKEQSVKVKRLSDGEETESPINKIKENIAL